MDMLRFTTVDDGHSLAQGFYGRMSAVRISHFCGFVDIRLRVISTCKLRLVPIVLVHVNIKRSETIIFFFLEMNVHI